MNDESENSGEKLSRMESSESVGGNAVSSLDDLAARIKAQIDAAYDTNDEPFRSHLGASVIGDECARRIYYHWNWFKAEDNTAREERIFLRGHKIEEEIRAILVKQGAIFIDGKDESSKQLKVTTLDGHFGGSVDGKFIWPAIGIHTPMLLECKSNKTGATFDVVDKKHLSLAKPQHWAQVCTYNVLLGCTHVVYIIKNKNDEQIKVKVVETWEKTGLEMIQKADYLIHTDNPPPRISNKPEHFICKVCQYNAICHGKEQPTQPNCRNCASCKPVENGNFHCAFWDAIIPKEHLIKGCPHHTWKRY